VDAVDDGEEVATEEEVWESVSTFVLSGVGLVMPSMANTAAPPARANEATIFTSIRVRRPSVTAFVVTGSGVDASSTPLFTVP
jgi:hypothetical protein